MKTLEQIAREAAELLAPQLVPPGRPAPHMVADAVLAALREATAPPGDPPVSEGRLEQIAGQRKQPGEWSEHAGDRAVDDLTAQLNHYRRLCAFLLREPEGRAYAQGYDEGRKASLDEAEALGKFLLEVAGDSHSTAFSGSLEVVVAVREAFEQWMKRKNG